MSYRATSTSGLRVPVLALFAAGAILHGCDCGSTGVETRRFPCESDDQCAEGFVCREGECVPSEKPDAGEPDAGNPTLALAFSSSSVTVVAGTCSPAVMVESRDFGGAPIAVESTVPVALSASAAGVSFFSDDQCASPITEVTLAAGTSSAKLFFLGTIAGSTTLTASANGLAAAQQTETITPAPASALGFTTPPSSAVAGDCVPATVAAQDAFRNVSAPTTSAVVTLAASDGSGAAFYSDASCTLAITDVAFPPEGNAVSFFFRTTVAGTVTLTANSTGLTSANQMETIRPAAAASVVFSSPLQTVIVGTCAQATLQALDAFGNVAPVTSAIDAALSAAPGGVIFYSDAGCTAPSATATLATGASSIGFWFSGTSTGSVILTATTGSLGSPQQTEIFQPAAANVLVFGSAPQSPIAGTCIQLTLNSQDASGNPSPVTSATTVSLAASPSTGATFYAGSTCTTATPTTTIPAGASTVTFSFRGTAAGAVTVTVSATGFNSAVQTETVRPGTAITLVFQTSPQTATAGSCKQAIIEARDTYGNPAPAPSNVLLRVTASPNGGFNSYLGTNCTNSGTRPLLQAGMSSISFWWLDTLAGTVTISVTGTGYTSASQPETIVAGPPTVLGFTPGSQTITAGVCSSATVQTEDAYGNVSPATALVTINLTAAPSTSFGFYSSMTCGTAITSTTLAAGTSSRTVQIRGTLAGVVTITASATGFTSGTQAVTVAGATPSSLVFTTTAQTKLAGACSGTATVQARDIYGNAANVGANTAVTLSVVPAGGLTFFSNSTCTTQVASVTMAIGTSTASFFFKGTTAGSMAAAAATSFGSANQTEIILANVQTGTCAVPNGTTGVTCMISPALLDTTKTMLFFQTSSYDNTAQSSNVRCRLTSTTALVCDRSGTGTAGFSGQVDVSWQTVELASGITVQHLSTTCGATTPFTVPITPVASTADTFLLGSGLRTGADQSGDDFYTLDLPGNAGVEYEFDPSNPCTLDWAGAVQVVEIPGIAVTRGVTAPITGTGLTLTGLPPVNLASTVLLIDVTFDNLTVADYGPAICARMFRAEMTAPDTITLTRGNGSTDPACSTAPVHAISWQRIDFGTRARVQAVDAAMSFGFASATATIAAVDLSRSMALSSGQAIGGQGGGETDFSGDDILGVATAQHLLPTSTSLRLTRNATSSTLGAGTWSAYVIEWVP